MELRMADEYSIEIAVDIMEIDFYRAKRYNTPMTIALFESECIDIFMEQAEKSLRVTDIIQYIDKKRFIVIFGNTNVDGSEIAINKMIKNTEGDCYNKIFVGFTEVRKHDTSSKTTIMRAQAGLKLALTDKSKNVVII
jgi:hypothetical protein